ncbi:hypothetical protein L484_000738 [Morus notabilis]|uniref:Uncharacterized protein n=1 Tax=Morus notabilis TaxID=981085 RepID=W9SJF1_9ROSA|nr:hypothetical protein L484_000738 [Morus notabilis]
MENGTAVDAEQHLNFCRDEDGEPERASAMSIRAVLYMIRANLDDRKPPVPLGHGDPSAFPRFRTPTVAEDAIVDALRSANFNHYSSPANGFLSRTTACAAAHECAAAHAWALQPAQNRPLGSVLLSPRAAARLLGAAA